MSTYPRAYLTQDEQGRLLLVDPDAVAVAQVVEEHNRPSRKEQCRKVLELNQERVTYFQQRLHQLQRSPQEVAICIINVDDLPYGREITKLLMPGQDELWQRFREQGQTPFARGLSDRAFLTKCAQMVDPHEAEKLTVLPPDATVVFTFDASTVLITTPDP